jgi:enoyl-CoA hydratase
MPEIFIGSLPDVGSTRFLNSCPGRVGLWMALTGARIGPADAIYTGLATHFVREADLPELTGTLADGVAPDRFARDPGDAPLRSLQPAIDRCFSHATIEEILAALQREPGEWAREAVSAMNRASPLSLKLTLEALQRSAGSTLEQALSLEFRVVQHLLDGPDFYEGVRAVLIDKDHSPRWSFASVADVTDDVVARHFASLGSRELTF